MYTLKNKGASKCSSSDAKEEQFWYHKEPFVKQKGSSDVKGSLWNHLDKKCLLWHHEAPLFLRVKMLGQNILKVIFRSIHITLLICDIHSHNNERKRSEINIL